MMVRFAATGSGYADHTLFNSKLNCYITGNKLYSIYNDDDVMTYK